MPKEKNNASMKDLQLAKEVFAKIPKKKDAQNVPARDYLKMFTILDAQDAIGRYKWKNIPCDMSSREIEKLLYCRGDLCFFYDKDLNKFFMMPYALNGTIDELGRYVTITPVPIAFDGKDADSKSELLKYFGAKKLKVIYDVVTEVTEETLYNSAVILHDYSNEFLVQNKTVPRSMINRPLVELEADMIPYCETNLVCGTGVKPVKSANPDDAGNIMNASGTIRASAKAGNLLVPFTNTMDPLELNLQNRANSQEYFLSLQSLDNLRLGLLGLENGGLFEKKAHVLQAEQDAMTSNCGVVYQDGLSNRQHFADIINSIWALDFGPEPSEAVLGVDDDGDGRAYDIEDDGMEDDLDEEIGI